MLGIGIRHRIMDYGIYIHFMNLNHSPKQKDRIFNVILASNKILQNMNFLLDFFLAIIALESDFCLILAKIGLEYSL